MIFQPKFVHYMPKEIEDGILYISPEFRAVIHRCACGCGEKVHTPLAPTNWTMTYNGKNVTLDPSIGNWSYDCRSHYWIRDNKVVWAENWSDAQVNKNREYDRQQSKSYFKTTEIVKEEPELKLDDSKTESTTETTKPLWKRFFTWLGL